MTLRNGTHGTDGQTDGQTDRQSATQYAAPSYGGGPHNNASLCQALVQLIVDDTALVSK